MPQDWFSQFELRPQAEDWFAPYVVSEPKPPSRPNWFQQNAPKPTASDWWTANAPTSAQTPSVSLDEFSDRYAKELGLRRKEQLNPTQRRAARTAWETQKASAAPRSPAQDEAYRTWQEGGPFRAEGFMPPPPDGSALGRFGSGAWEMLNPIEMAKGIGHAVMNPIDTASSVIAAQGQQFVKAYDAAKQGRYSEMVGHGAAGLIPLVGPVAANVGERIGEGDIAGGLGAATGLVGGVLAPGAAVKAAKNARIPAPFANGNAVTAAAVEAGAKAGVPIDAATATGNRAIGAVQHMADRSLLGSQVAEKAAQQQAQGLATMGEQLAAKANATGAQSGAAVTAEQAGEGVRQAVRGQIAEHGREATTHYDKLRQIEADPANLQTVTITEQGRLPGGGSMPVQTQQQMPLPVDLRQVKQALEPTYQALKREAELVPLMGDKARALTALDRLVGGPDYAPLSVVDSALGELKAFARSDVPELRTVGQGAAAGAVRRLDAVVRDTARRAGPEALDALEQGRAATIRKHGAGDTFKPLAEAEPVGIYRQLTASKDSGVQQLREIAAQAPDQLPQIGRAVLDELMGQATQGGSFEHAAAIASRWEKLGAETKRLLYRDPGYIKELDQFFHLAKATARNANPSGTAHALAAAGQGGAVLGALTGTIEPLTAIATLLGPAAVSKFLHSQAGVKLLTKGIRIPLGNKTARSAWAAQVTALAQELGFGRPGVPALADDEAEWRYRSSGRW
jgi:hypothetical protein